MKVIFMATVHGNKGDTDNDVIQKISPLPPIMIKVNLGESCISDSQCHRGKE